MNNSSVFKFSNFKIPIISLVIFLIIGLFVWLFRGNVLYFYLFMGIGIFEFNTRVFISFFPKFRQITRLSVQFVIGAFLLIWLGLFKGVNFQFSQLFFDMYQGIITGVLIQIVVARLIIPFFFGNAFCSRACWTGFVFELTNQKTSAKKVYKRNQWLAFGYMFLLIVIAVYIIFFWKPIFNDDFKKYWIIIENVIILLLGFILTFFIGSRAYCRLLCPFLTISSFIAPYSIFKIRPVNADNCIQCNKCDKVCPMLIHVSEHVSKNEEINNKYCIACERCVSACNEDVLSFTNKQK